MSLMRVHARTASGKIAGFQVTSDSPAAAREAVAAVLAETKGEGKPQSVLALASPVQPDPTPQNVESNYASDPLWRLVGSTIVSFGANSDGDLYLKTSRGDEFQIGIENGEPALYQIEKVAS